MDEQKTIWCPYLGEYIDNKEASLEHIIPLSLGGCDAFTIRTHKELNSRFGADIDGALSNEFLIALRRVQFNAKGNSRESPKAILKKTVIQSTGEPAQIVFSEEGVRFWDPKKNMDFELDKTKDTSFKSTFKVQARTRLRFMCKVALSSGQFIYSDNFRKFFQHDELRSIVNTTDFNADHFSGYGLRVYDEFSKASECDSNQFMLDNEFCKIVQGSCVMTIPGPSSIGFVIGILGKWIGTLNVPAETAQLPLDDDFDLGHVVRLENGKMRRHSYRTMAREALQLLQK